MAAAFSLPLKYLLHAERHLLPTARLRALRVSVVSCGLLTCAEELPLLSSDTGKRENWKATFRNERLS